MELKGSNISYKYPSTNKYILKDIDICIDNSKITVVVESQHYAKYFLDMCKNLKVMSH